MGHYKIACITGKRSNPVYNARVNGHTETNEKMELPSTEGYILEM